MPVDKNMTMANLTAANCVMPVNHIGPCYIWVEYTSDEWSVDARLATTKNKKKFCSCEILTGKWSSTAVTYSTTVPPLSTSTTDVMTHTPHSADSLWQTPGLQSDSTTRDKRQKVKKFSLALQRNNKSQTFMNLMCRAKASHSPFLSVWLNRKLTLSK